MKMRTKTLFALAFAGMVLAGCAKDNISEGRGGADQDVNAEGGWMSLKINTPQTRALNPGFDRELGTEDEMWVNSVRILTFSDTGGPASVLDVIDINNFTRYGSLAITEVFQVHPMSQYIMVCVNPTDDMLANIEIGTTFSSINRGIEATVLDVTNNGFLMTNSSGHLEPYMNASLQNYIKATPDAAERFPFTVNVDRVVAKVRVYMEDGVPSGELMYDYPSVKWGLNLTNRLYYPMSERIPTAAGRILWNDTYGLGSYRIDPNFDWVPSLDFEFNFDGPTGNYTVDWKSPTNAPDRNQHESQDNEKLPVEYCLENTFDQPYSVHGFTTHAVLRMNVWPPSVDSPYGGSYTVNPGEDWLIVAGGRYTFQTLMEWIQFQLGNRDTSLAEAFNSYLSYIGMPPVFLGNLDDVIGIVSEFDSRLPQVESHGGDTNGFVTYYAGGMNYYKIMIKHDNQDEDWFINQLGEFGVVRNSVYDINITAINSAGYPFVPIPDTNMPNEQEFRHLSVSINVNPWAWYTQDEEL